MRSRFQKFLHAHGGYTHRYFRRVQVNALHYCEIMLKFYITVLAKPSDKIAGIQMHALCFGGNSHPVHIPSAHYLPGCP